MTVDYKPHVDDVGTVLRVQVLDQDGQAVDITSATGLVLTLQRPDGTKVTKTPTKEVGTQGWLTYTVVAEDLDQAGWWKLQTVVTFTSAVYHSSIESFQVYPNL